MGVSLEGEDRDVINEISPYGGNVAAAEEEIAAEEEAKKKKREEEAGMWDWVDTSNVAPHTPQRAPEPPKYTPEQLEAMKAIDVWGQLGRAAQDLPTSHRADDLMRAREQGQANRADQLALLDMIGQRQSAIPAQETSAMNQAMMGMSADPRERLMQLRGMSQPLAQQAMGARSAEGLQQMGELGGGAANIRGQDINRAAAERGIYGSEIQRTLANEALALQAFQQAEAEKAAMSGAMLGLEEIQAGQPSGFDFWNRMWPGITNAGAGLASAYFSQGQQQPQSQAVVSPNNLLGAGESQAVNQGGRYGNWSF